MKLQYLTDITEDFGDLISIPYSDSVAYISFELENIGGYTNATLDALINEFAQNMTAITDNDFVIYSKNYNTTGLDSSYIQPTLMIYLNPADEETFINDQLSTFKQSTSLNRMYTQIPTAIKVLASEFQSSIIDNLRSVPDPGTLTQSNATSLANEDVIIFNNNSATTNYTINVSELSVTGKDVWDSTSGWLIEMNTTDVFTVSVPGYSAATIFFEYLDHIEMSSLTSGTVYKADSPSAANANYTDGQQDGNWMVSTDSDLQIELFDQHYIHSEFITYYGWLNVSFLSQPTGWEEYEVAIIADKNNAELDALNYTATEFYGYISVSDYNNTQSWNDAKAAEVDYWLSLNESMNIFVDGLDYAIVTANFSTRMKQLIDYIQITKTRKAILNTYTAYTDFATWGNGGVMKESCVNRWNGANPSAPISYTRENWTLELERSVWYTSHDIPVFCQAFDNRTNDGTYTIVNYTELQNIYFASKVLGYDNFWLSQPDFQYAHDEYVYDVGAKLGRNAQQLAADPNVYYRAYENGIVYYNITSEQGWIDDGLIVNSIETCFYLYNNQVGNVWNFNINDRDSTGDVGEYSLVQDNTFTWEWKCVDTSDEEPINGRYLVEAWVGDHTVSPGYNIAYSVVAGEGGHSWSDTSATDSYVAYPNGQNWMVSVESNFTIRVSIDTTPNILQVISEISRPVIGVEFTNISINSSRAFPIEVWSNPITTSINEFQNVSFYNSTGDWVALNYANNSDCDTNSPTWATTLIEGETFKACVEPSGADTLVRVGAPSLSTRLFQVSSPTTEPFIEFLTPPTPTEAEFIIDASINLTVNLTEEYFLNLTFDINGNKTTYTDATRSYIQTLSDGHYSVNATVSTTTGYSNTTEQRTFALDTTYPVVSLISPANGSEYNSSWSNIEINFSSSDANLGTCWYNTGGANSTITCNTNISYLVQEGAVNFIYYVNDTAGHLASANLTISGGDFVVDISNSTTNIVVSNGTSYWEENASLTFNSSAPSTSWFDWLVDGASKLTGWGENVFNWVFNLTADSPSATVTLDTGKYCYQESANTSNQTGIDGDCDLNYGGTWIYNIGLDEEINDGDNSTYGEIGTAYVTYNITENVTGATWKVIDYTGAHNLTVPQDSLISGELEFKINSGATFGGTSLYWVYWYVKDSSSSWVLLQSASSSTVGEYTRVFEEAVEWEMGNIATEEFLIVTNSEAPVFNLVNVTTASIYELGENVSIDFNVSDPNLDSCWYGYHSANTSFACTSGVEKEVNVTSTAGTASITFYANDTLGNMNSTSVNYTVDSIAPIVNATSPNETFGYTVFGGNETLNWTVTDANLDSCWYAYPRMEENISDSDFDSDTYWNFKNGTMTNTSGENVLSSVILVPTDIVALKVNLATNGLSISNFDSSVPDCNTVHYNEYSPLVNNGWYACVKDTANRTYVIEQISSDNFTSYDYTTDINCSGITEEFVPVAGQNSITVYANDTIGNIGNSTTSWSYVILETSQTFSNTTVETNAESFSINVTYSSSLWNSITTSLFYDGTEYAGITTGTGDDIVISRSIYIPGVTNATNKTFYWEIQLSNITGTYSYYSNNQTQLVNVVGFEICDYADDPQIFFKTFSTTEPTTSVNATFKSAWTIRNADGGEAVLSRSFQDLSETNSTFGFCIDPNSTTYTLSIDVEVDASAYTRTYHYIVDTDYTAVTQNVSLYLLNDSYSTLTKLIVKDIDSSPVEDVYVTIQRYDIGTDTYYNVGQARTDSDGSDLAYLQWYDYWYKFIGVKDGEVVFTNGPKKVSESPLNFITGTTSGDDNVTSEITGFLDWRDITYDLSFSDSGNNFVLTFVDTTGLAQESCLKTIKRNVTNDYLICDSCVTSASGTLYCNIDGYGNGTFIAEYYINTPTYIFIDNLYEYVNNDVPIFDLIGNDNGTGLAILTAGIVLAFFLISPALGIVGMIIGMVIVVALGFQPFEIVSFMGMVVVGVLLMWAVKK